MWPGKGLFLMFGSKPWPKDVNGQIFYVRGNEIMIFRQFEVARSVHRGEGWTPQTIIDHCMPALKPSMSPPRMAHEITTWDPV